MKIIAHSIRFLAIFPLNFNLEYRVLSLAWFWSLIYGVFVFVVDIIYTTTDGWRSVTKPVYQFRGFIFFLSSMISSERLSKLINSFEDFDLHFQCIFSFPIRHHFLNNGLLWVLFNVLITIGLKMLVYLYDPCSFKSLMLTYVSFSSYGYRQLWIHLYIYICFNLQIRFKQVRLNWIQNITLILNRNDIPTVTNINDEEFFESTRLLYAELCQLVEEVNKTFEIHISLFYITIFIEILLDFYKIYYLQEVQEDGKMIFTFVSLGFIFVCIVCWISGEVTSEVSELIKDTFKYHISIINRPHSWSQFRCNLK